MNNNIRRWREARGLSQEALGRLVGLSKPTISKLERGGLHLRDVTIAKLVDALDVTAGELLGDFANAPPAVAAAPRSSGPAADGETDFGFRRVARDQKPRLVGGVFTSVARRYDLMNDLMSVGVHRLWKSEMVDWLRPRAGLHLVDVAGGTGDIALRVLERTSGAVRIAVCDANEAMLQVGRDRALDRGVCTAIDWLCGDAERLPFADASTDAYTIAFGIRNVTRIDAALAEARRVLRPGGRFLCLEFSRVAVPGLGALYDAYSFEVLPALGEVVAGDRAAYRYLAESIRTFPDQERFAAMIAAAGLGNVSYRNLSGGIAALHSAWRI
ncbi:MAG: bifunctional demethylmenaquinone methyltransferase/2-methoxy-6-polyprenyl-1,4-benzoquinol methylase UbiE [Alphaproteobacteria bacterium]